MNSNEEIFADPYAWGDCEKLNTQLEIVTNALKTLTPEKLKQLRQLLEPALIAEAEKQSALYRDYLSNLSTRTGRLAIDCEKRPIEFIAAQIEFPKLRDLFRRSKAASVFLNLFRRSP